MSYQKIKSCPKCGSDHVAVYKYDSGWVHVECDGCWYLGPGEGSIRQAIKSHNDRSRSDVVSRDWIAESITLRRGLTGVDP